jgi:sigma-B regulation protein RsbU (phosphoserine phosphatase)
MASPNGPHILLCAADLTAVEDTRRLLEEAGQSVATHRLGASDPPELGPCRLIVVEGGGNGTTWSFCRRLRAHLGDDYIPLLLLTGDPTPAARLAGFEAGIDACLPRPFVPGELMGQVKALLRIKDHNDRLAEKSAQVHHLNERLQLAHQRVDEELELARRIQVSFLPRVLPEAPHVRFAVHYRPCGRVGGDFYDVFRLDEHHVGFYIADAMGHGVPASLLTIFLKRGVRPKEIEGNGYRLVPPGEVLQRLNHELIEQSLADNPFITMAYGLLDTRAGILRFARAGHPHPAHVPATGEVGQVRVEGSLLGLFEAQFPVRTLALAPGDKVLLHTDGAEAVAFEGLSPGPESLLACANRHRALPIGEFVERVARDMVRQTDQPDDFTLLGLEMMM